MPWPPVVPPTTRANNALALDTHPTDHNQLAQAVNDVVAQINAVPWIALPLNANFTPLSGNTAPGYRKVGDVVQLRGAVSYSTTTAGVAVTTLPAGYRPAASMIFLVLGNLAVARFDLASTGVLTFVRIEALTTGGNMNFFTLAQISFSVLA